MQKQLWSAVDDRGLSMVTVIAAGKIEARRLAHDEMDKNESRRVLLKKWIAAGATVRVRPMGKPTTTLCCLECDHRFKKVILAGTCSVKCPKCGGYDTELD